MTDEPRVEDGSEDADDEQLDEDGEAVDDFLVPLRELANEAANDKERVRAVTSEAKDQLAAQLEKLQSVQTSDETAMTIVESQVAALSALQLLLDEQGETFALFLADFGELAVKNVEQLRNNDDDLYEAIQGEGGSGYGGDEDEPLYTDSVLLPRDGNAIAGMLHEYRIALQTSASQAEEGSESQQMSVSRIQQIGRMLQRVKDITLIEEPDEAPQPEAPSGAAEAQA